MTKNRKTTERYRFNGSPFLHSFSIHSVEIHELESRIESFRRKLEDPDDFDDKKWTQRWLTRFEKELAKKLDSREKRSREKSKRIDRQRCDQ